MITALLWSTQTVGGLACAQNTTLSLKFAAAWRNFAVASIDIHNVKTVQERSHNIEAQLSETTKQLHDLRMRQKQLEARNALLEKVAKLNQQPSCESPSETSPSPSGSLPWTSIQVHRIYMEISPVTS